MRALFPGRWPASSSESSISASVGQVVRESTETRNLAETRRMLHNREGDVAKGVLITPDVGRISFDEAAEDLLNDYAVNRKRTLGDAKRRIKKYTSPCFGNRRLISITTAGLRSYIAKRQKDGLPVEAARGEASGEKATHRPVGMTRPVSPAEISRELTVLKRMFSLPIQAGNLVQKPHFAMLREDNVRKRFFERQQYQSILKLLPEAMRPVVTFAYVTGWRIGSEVLPLEWRQVDLIQGRSGLSQGRRSTARGECST